MKKIIFMLVATIIAISASAQTKQTKRALVIGISNYPKCGADSWGAIHGANDAELIERVLNTQGFKVTKVCNEAATAKRIRNELDAIVDSCKSGDTVYLHFSCHGQPFEDKNHDEQDGWDESIVPYDAQMSFKKGKYEGQNHIIDDELHTYFQTIRKKIGPKGFVCVVYDACHSGGSSREENDTEDGDDDVFVRGTDEGFSPSGNDYLPNLNKTDYFKIQKEEYLAHIAILEACLSTQENREIKENNDHYGPLSYYVCQVLKENKLLCGIDWISKVRTLMNNDNRLTTQNMVIETSLEKTWR